MHVLVCASDCCIIPSSYLITIDSAKNHYTDNKEYISRATEYKISAWLGGVVARITPKWWISLNVSAQVVVADPVPLCPWYHVRILLMLCFAFGVLTLHVIRRWRRVDSGDSGGAMHGDSCIYIY